MGNNVSSFTYKRPDKTEQFQNKAWTETQTAANKINCTRTENISSKQLKVTFTKRPTKKGN